MAVRIFAGRVWSAYSTGVDKAFGLVDPAVLMMLRASAWMLSQLEEESLRYDAPGSLRGWFARDGALTLWRQPEESDPIDEVYRRVGVTESFVVMFPIGFQFVLMLWIGDFVGAAFGAVAEAGWITVLAATLLHTIDRFDAIAVEVEHG